MNYEQATELISLLKERNDIEKQRNKILEGIENELYRIRGNL